MSRWTKAEEELLIKFYGVIPVKEIQAIHIKQRSIKSITVKADNMGLTSRLSGNKYTTTHDSRMKTGEFDKLDKLWDAIIDFQSASQPISNRTDHTTFSIDTDKPIALAFVADAHIGAITCKYSELRDRFNEMAATDGLYLISIGDTHDNYNPGKHPAGMFEQIIPPSLQKQLVEYLYMKMKGRWIAAIGGCHEAWSHDVDDYDWTEYLSRKLECANLGEGGTVSLTVGPTTYEIMARHKYRFNSSLNMTHSVKRMREQLGDFDIGALAHFHTAAIEQVMLGDGKDRVFIRPGSFKGADRWSRQIGFTDVGAFIPTVILFPNEKRMIPFLHLSQARTVLKSLRG